jgi:hypothetical protein
MATELSGLLLRNLADELRAADFAVRTLVPLALDAVGLPLDAEQLRGLAPITDVATADAANRAALSAARRTEFAGAAFTACCAAARAARWAGGSANCASLVGRELPAEASPVRNWVVETERTTELAIGDAAVISSGVPAGDWATWVSIRQHATESVRQAVADFLRDEQWAGPETKIERID